MEVMKQEFATCEYKDIKFTFRTKASISDKLAKDKLLAEALKAGSIEAMPRIGKGIVKMFLHGWEGVTLDGKPVPYSFDTLEHSFPAEIADELMPLLVKFVKDNVDILK